MPERFRLSKIEGGRIAELVRGAPAPVYRTGTIGLNVFPYVPGRIMVTDVAHLPSIAGPAWLAVTPEQATALMEKRRGVRAVISVGHPTEFQLLRVDP
jgi:hypothetical protein